MKSHNSEDAGRPAPIARVDGGDAATAPTIAMPKAGSRGRPGPVLAALFVAAFVMGTAELVVVGILPQVADRFAVSTGTAGMLVTSYALGISLAGPALAALVVRRSRRVVVLVSLAAYVAGTGLAAAAPNYGVLLTARVMTGALHGLFIGAAFVVAAGVVSPARVGTAISVVLGGIAGSTAVGVPLGTVIGQDLGWRVTFVAIAVLGVAALAAATAALPAVPAGGAGGTGAGARAAFAPRVLAVLGVGLMVMGGQFAAFTYITPFLLDVAGVPEGLVGVFLLGYGLANALGTFAGGWAADRDAARTLPLAVMALVVALAALWVGGTSPAVVIGALAIWGVVGFGLVPSLQYRVVALAGPGRDLAAALPASAITLGIALGALVGGRAVEHGPTIPVLTALVVCTLGVPLAWATARLRPPAPDAAPAAAPSGIVAAPLTR